MLLEGNLEWRYLDTDSQLLCPWYTLPALQWLKQQDVSKWNVFEYGAGYSTIWWRANCSMITSVENQESWAKAMGAISETEKDSYVQCIDVGAFDLGEHYDCIIVDGVHREECTEFCLPYLKQGGYLIIDNYDSENYDINKTVDLLKDWPRVLHKQPNHSQWITAIFTKP